MFRMRFEWADLEDFWIGRPKLISTRSEAMAFILQAEWFNFTWEERDKVEMEMSQVAVVKVCMSRLGVWIEYPIQRFEDKSARRIFIQLYDNRIMKINCFCIQTYKELFSDFGRTFVQNSDESETKNTKSKKAKKS